MIRQLTLLALACVMVASCDWGRAPPPPPPARDKPPPVAERFESIAPQPRPDPRPSSTPAPRKPAEAAPRQPLPQPEASTRDSQEHVRRSDRRRGVRSCAAELGGSSSAYLVRQCRVVNGSWDRSCTADATCEDLRERIAEGCAGRERKPGFCYRT